ncbi:dihydrofolate synthase [Bacteroides pyogenes JCM 10003]|nr:dihydrofolate synthase [Bacteroides pyogenes JCM 10003]
MDYQNTLKYLYESIPMFQQIGASAYKPGLATMNKLDEYFNHPHRQFKTIHIAGTNGKGSCSHTVAAVLQSAGYRVGLFTSPHLIDFRERIRVNGEMVSEEYVVRFVEQHRALFEPLHPSFFELTTAMALRYFADEEVDVAVIEVGMGGRLDCTNIIRPDLCVITNIGYDHMQYLGGTLPEIAQEKAGIIKEGIPVVVGRAEGDVKKVLSDKARQMSAPCFYAEEAKDTDAEYFARPMQREELKAYRERLGEALEKNAPFADLKGTHRAPCETEAFFAGLPPMEYFKAIDEILEKQKSVVAIRTSRFPHGLFMEMGGHYQTENCLTILTALQLLEQRGYKLRRKDYLNGFAHVCDMTSLMGRWQKLRSHPDLICDTGHNEDGIKWIAQQLDDIHRKQQKELHIVFGMVNDKDISGVLPLLPPYATYYFTKAGVKRALPENDLMEMARKAGLKGEAYPNVPEAVKAAQEKCLPEDFIFVEAVPSL